MNDDKRSCIGELTQCGYIMYTFIHIGLFVIHWTVVYGENGGFGGQIHLLQF